MKIGYARVSTHDQDTALQLDALRRAGVKRVYSENGSSVGPRPQLQNALASLRPGDVLVVWKIDRMARSLPDLLHLLERLKQTGAGLQSLTEPIDTSTPMGEFVLQILGAVAQLERSMIRERSVAGQAAAYRRGVRWGGRPKLTDRDLDDIERLHAQGWYTWATLADMWGVHLNCVQRTRKKRADGPVLPPVLRSHLDNPRT